MPEDTVDISLQARIMLAVENAYRDGWTDRNESWSFNTDSDWNESDTKRAMES